MSQKIQKSSSSPFEVLPWDFIANEILPRLPHKSLFRFKCVSKLWNSHISSPNFARVLNPVFLCSSPRDNAFVYFFLRGTRQFTKLERVPESAKFLRPIGSCNGIAAFVAFSTDFSQKYTILWNPSNNHSLDIGPPHPGGSPEPPEFCAAVGYDPRTNDYKVVHVWYLGFWPSSYVYSLKSLKWKAIDIDENIRVLLHERDVKIRWMPQCSADGTRVYWLANYKDLEGTLCRRMLLSFDVSDEAFSLVNLPDFSANNDNVHLELASLVRNNLVSLFVYDKEYNSRKDYFVWEMKGYGVNDSWTKFKISLGEPGRPLGYVNRYKFLFLSGSGKILSYDTETEEKEYLQIHDTEILYCVGNYMESQVKFSYPQT